MSTRPKKPAPMKSAKKTSKKKKYWNCAHQEHYYDDLCNVMLCNNPKSGTHECICKDIFQTNACPFFKRGDRSAVLEISLAEQASLDEFKSRLAQEACDVEAKERALYAYLKKKFEKR